mgnify:CR=1 FL=1
MEDSYLEVSMKRSLSALALACVLAAGAFAQAGGERRRGRACRDVAHAVDVRITKDEWCADAVRWRAMRQAVRWRAGAMTSASLTWRARSLHRTSAEAPLACGGAVGVGRRWSGC